MDTWQSIMVWQQGIYSVTVTDANNATAQASINVFPPTSVNVQLEAVQQYGEAHTACTIADGILRIHLQGGQPPYNIDVNRRQDRKDDYNNMPTPAQNGYYRYFNTSDTLIELDSLEAGWYDVKINDMNQCGSGSGVELHQAEAPRVTVNGTEYENGYYFSCDTCADAQMTAVVTGGNGNMEYYWFETPAEQANMSLKGASLFMKENKDYNTSNLPPAVSTSQTATIVHAETSHGLVVADALGCVGFTNFTLEKPKPVTGWQLKGNTADSLSVIGTVNMEDLRLVTNDTVRMVVKADGEVKLNAYAFEPGSANELKVLGINSAGELKLTYLTASAYLPECTPPITPWVKAPYQELGQNNISLCSYENVGIGWFNPTHKLHVDGDMKINSRLGINTDAVQMGNGAYLKVVASGIDDYPAEFIATHTNGRAWYATTDNNILFSVPKLENGGYNYLSQTNDAGLFWTDGAGNAGHNESAGFVIGPWGDGAKGIKISASGSVGIGTSPLFGKLHVYNSANGTISLLVNSEFSSENHFGIVSKVNRDDAHAFSVFKDDTENFVVRGDGHVWARGYHAVLGAFPDYVFDDDYELCSLTEVEKYINENHHLPEVPSEAEVKNNGFNLAEMDALLLKKIEELTLYMIEMKKENEELKSKVEQLQNH